jgi:hypothetical protein
MQLPEGAGRLAVFIDGTESAEDLATLKVHEERSSTGILQAACCGSGDSVAACLGSRFSLAAQPLLLRLAAAFLYPFAYAGNGRGACTAEDCARRQPGARFATRF